MNNRRILVRARSQLCALPITAVAETLRPLPTTHLAGLPPWVLGMAVIRGHSVPVVDLGRLLGVEGPPDPRRLVLMRSADRPLALSVEAVVGIDDADDAPLDRAAPPMREGIVESFGVHRQELLAVLSAGHLLPAGVPNTTAGMPP